MEERPFRGSTAQPSRGAPSRLRSPIGRKRASGPAGSSSIAASWMRRPRSNMSQPSPSLSGSASCIATDPTVFLTPPWPEIFHSDPERRHGWDEAAAEYERLARAYPELGYRVAVLPKASVKERADAVLAELSGDPR